MIHQPNNKKISIPVCGYEVKIGSGLSARIGAEVCAVTRGKVLVVTDETVAPLYLGKVYRLLTEAGLSVCTASVPAGESSKSLKNYEYLLQILSAKRLTRSDAVLALGGGVVGDLSGFAAATYLRGIPLIQVPTTLLAMVDSSVGGKTAVNLPEQKNAVGAFYQPSLVLCDTDFLATLNEETFSDGCAEIIKTAILFDADLFSHLQAHGLSFDRESVISRCVMHKRDIVTEDETDRGKRRLLNLGHTAAHAIEALSGYTVSHGKAVAVGLAIMARAFCEQREEILSLLQKFRLPTETEFSPEALAAAAANDKKRSGDTITLALAETVGHGSLRELPVSALAAVFRAGMEDDKL